MQMIDGKKAKRLIEKGALLFDVRDPVSFRDGTLPGAINLTLRQVSTLMKHDRKVSLIFFGNNSEDTNLRSVLNYALQMGFLNIYSLGSINNWNV